MKDILIRGFYSGLRTTWTLSKIIVPITFALTLLKHTPVLEWILWLFTPIMGWFGLPGEAAIVMALGWFLNLYAAIGAMFSLQLGAPEALILSVMLSFCHNIFVETAVAKRIGLNAPLVVSIRAAVGFLGGWGVHLALGNTPGDVIGTYGHLQYLWDVSVWTTVQEVLFTIWKGVYQLALIVIPLMLVIQVLKELRVLDKIATGMNPLLALCGLDKKAAIPMLAGIFFGLAYGAGVIIEATREKPLPKRQLYLLMIFLILCHAVVEDTLIFIPLHVNGWYLLGIRIIAALVLTAVLARVWRERVGTGIRPGVGGVDPDADATTGA
ncbi:nucleoside recognition domain-containing protein [Tumebacillus permanentifrigoris]|uniref:Nucleoside recognition protein n=1 Tax=Tumebacillus permanentifrigoris TaxID=378543 RepID=A0A316DUZ4_9BACL|nr:nucleoside recognition domain-containing protein [Tumebacillus permanentifrigoris]PWK13002.1 nucleoside recognition protein [Tumebacillus permanentifrigoris]